MRRTLLLIVMAACTSALAVARPAVDDGSRKAEGDELTLERLFPEKGLFGPSARGMAFSHDGAHAAYLYRPYKERRHGSDLWILDVATGTTTRVTSVSVMAKYQDRARKVRKDRIEKQKKARKKAATAADRDKRDEDGVDEDTSFPEDGISGVWEGVLTGGASLGLSDDGLPVTLTLRRAEDGALSGSLTWLLSRLRVTQGAWDADAGKATCTLRADDGTTVRLEVTVEGQELAGSFVIEGRDATLTLTARRRAAETQRDDGEAEEEDREDEGQGEDREEDGEGDDEQDDKVDLGDLVTDDDADDEKAPRYDGISGFEWSPVAAELIFTADGDLYRYGVETGDIARLTRTSDRERDVQHLPDGSGYTYQRGSALVRVHFGEHLVEELNPPLGDGERMSGYRLSPDGRRLVVLATKGESNGPGRRVNIVSYRDRFAQVRQVPRTVSDDPQPKQEWSVYLYDLGEHLAENGAIRKVYGHEQSGPRDILRVPEWAPDSSRVAWSVFEQSSGHVEIVEARFLDPEADGAATPAGAGDEEAEQAEKTDDGDDDGNGGDKGNGNARGDGGAGADEDEAAKRIEEARVVYRFLHNGGPNTPSMIRPQYLPDSRRMVFIAELSGFRHLHVLDPTYEQLDQLTSGRFEVYPIDISKDHERLFCTATKDDPAQEHVFLVDLASGELRRLSTVEGGYSGAAVSDEGEHVLANLIDFGRLRELVAFGAGAEDLEVLTDSHPEEAKVLTEPVPEYFTFENRHGQTIHGHMFKPQDWSPDDRRPLLIYVYGGPLGTRKMITRGAFSAPSYFFAYYMARKHGYVTCTVDPRGASGYGGLFEKSNYEQVGKPQVEDLVDAARWFVEHQGVDEQRVGLHGWSFGGFQTQMCLYTEPKVFACGIAGAGPTEWENYNSWYSTGTIGPSREGKTDLEEFSLLPLAKNLEAKLLLVHGMEDSNVLYQDTVRVYRELLKAGKETLVELFLDPTGGHGLGGDVKTLNRYRKYEEFLLRTLGTGEPATAAVADEEGWIELFNGKDLEGWTPKFAGHELGVNWNDTFRVVDGTLAAVYDEYETFDAAFGHLFYQHPYSSYILRLEYRFTGEQTPGAPGWALRNSGVMIHGQDPETMRIEQPFPVSVEVQLLGGDGSTDRHTGNLCTPGTHVVMNGELVTRHCTDSSSKTFHGDEWVSVEVEVHGGEVIRHRINGETVLEYGQPQLDESDPDAKAWIERRGGERTLDAGTISLQAESQPVAFRNIRLKVIP